MLDALIDIGPADGPVIVLLHGRGSDERDLFPLGRMLHERATVVSVRAPFAAAPWGYGPGFAWYRFLGGTTPDPASFAEGQTQLAAFVDGLAERIGRPTAPLVLGGFSQGGTTSLAFLLRHPRLVHAALVFSGFLADDPSVRATGATVGTTPIFWGHGTADLAVPFAAAERGWAVLREAGANLTARAYPGMSHSISSEELEDARKWLARIV